MRSSVVADPSPGCVHGRFLLLRRADAKELLVELRDALDRVDLGDRLVGPQANDAREAQRVAGLVACRAPHAAERRLERGLGPDRARPAAVDLLGEALEQLGRLGDL